MNQAASTATTKYRTEPEETDGYPRGIPYIVGNEAAERFSYYGMRTILVVFMTHYLRDATGALAPMSEPDAMVWYHTFTASAYALPLVGAIVSDVFTGKYPIIVALSLVYCAGHGALALDETRLGLAVGLGLIAIGAGGIKPCVSAHVGDQFGARNEHLMERGFAWFYFAINAGSLISTLLTPVLLKEHGSRMAFGVPGVFMGLATLAFWLGRHHFAHIPPGGKRVLDDLRSAEVRAMVLRVIPLILFISVFWSLYDQNGSAWVLQAERMDLEFLGHTWLAEQIQAVNPVLVLVFIPLFSYALYPAISKVFPLTPLRKIGIGFVLMVLTFGISAFIEARLATGVRMSIGWQILAYAVLTASEVMVYGTGLSFFYEQAPNRLKSFVMGLFLLAVSIGNVFTALVNELIQDAHGKSRLDGPSYYLFFAALMLVTTALFSGYAARYREHRFVQGA
ncbi:MAG TPA: POT family MFS transporter [Polyangiales bacterium]|nr:POT family MFS transporter [Polyangiales bacterium]